MMVNRTRQNWRFTRQVLLLAFVVVSGAGFVGDAHGQYFFFNQSEHRLTVRFGEVWRDIDENSPSRTVPGATITRPVQSIEIGPDELPMSTRHHFRVLVRELVGVFSHPSTVTSAIELRPERNYIVCDRDSIVAMTRDQARAYFRQQPNNNPAPSRVNPNPPANLQQWAADQELAMRQQALAEARFLEEQELRRIRETRERARIDAERRRRAEERLRPWRQAHQSIDNMRRNESQSVRSAQDAALRAYAAGNPNIEFSAPTIIRPEQ